MANIDSADQQELFTVNLSSDSETDPSTPTNQRSSSVAMSDSQKADITSNGSSLDPDINPDEEEEKQRLINQVLELQNTLDDLSHRVDSVKEENLKLKSENQVLSQYIENLMAASSVFQSTSPNTKKKSNKKK
jgi:small-conductance mechanosensitive channel